MTEPQDPAAAGTDRLRAGHADREQAIEALKNAFTQGRLTGEELGTRTGQVLAARTYAELDAVTADIPGAPRLDGSSDLARPEVPGPPGLASRWPLAKASVKSGCLLAIAAAVVKSGNIIANGDYGAATGSYHAWIRVLNVLALALAVTAVVILGRGVAASVKQRRSRKQPPPRPAPGSHALVAAPHDGADHDRVPPRPPRRPTDSHLMAASVAVSRARCSGTTRDTAGLGRHVTAATAPPSGRTYPTNPTAYSI
jgi:Domain of unknown function (DUF1707)